MTNSSKIGVVICGGTGTVGQRFVQLLESHPFFYVAGIGASPRSAGKRYIDAVQWKLATPIPATTSNLIVQACDPDCFLEQGSDGASKIMFSGLDSDVAGEVEMSFLKAGWSGTISKRPYLFSSHIHYTPNFNHYSLKYFQMQRTTEWSRSSR